MVNISSMKHARGVSLDSRNGALQLASTWPLEFERQRREILELWDACHVPLLHRTYFFLLFKGDPSDAVYMEVELRRLCFLKSKIVRDGHMASRYCFFGKWYSFHNVFYKDVGMIMCRDIINQSIYIYWKIY